MNYIRSFFLIFLLKAVSCAEFKDVQLCNHGETACLKKTAQDIVNGFSKTGIPSINLSSFEPLPVKEFIIGRNPQSSVSLEMRFYDSEVLGLGSATVKNFKGFDRHVKETVEFDLLVPQLIIRGPYEIDGKVLILPIVGKGVANITFDNLTILTRAKFKKEEKNGKNYIQIDKSLLKMKTKKLHYSLNGLFNNNKDLQDNMLLFLNDNWQIVFDELEPNISKGFSVVINEVINNVFSAIPYEDLFLNGKE